MEFILPDGEAAFDRMLTKGNQLFQQSKKETAERARNRPPRRVGSFIFKVALRSLLPKPPQMKRDPKDQSQQHNSDCDLNPDNAA
jgi:hypothetical protein